LLGFVSKNLIESTAEYNFVISLFMTAILLIQLCLPVKVGVIPEWSQNDQCNVYNGSPIYGFIIDPSKVSKVYEYFGYFSVEEKDILEISGEPPVFTFDFDLFPHTSVQINVIRLSSDIFEKFFNVFGPLK
jgi:hypothetical protein